MATIDDVDLDGDLDTAGVQIHALHIGSCAVEDCSEPLQFSINRVGEVPNIDQASMWLTCDDLPSLMVEIYVWDSAFNPYAVQPDGTVGGPNYKFCEALVIVQDPFDLCGECGENGNEFTGINGLIATEDGRLVEDVEVSLTSSVIEFTQTEDDGTYEFTDIDEEGDFVITPYLNTGHRNGVTTMDVVIIQRHLLGVQPLESSYKMIAADVNNNGAVTTLDIIELRKLILGDIDEFTNNTSWRFIDRKFKFIEPQNPWFETIDESININGFVDCFNGQNFIAVKIGDVNETAITNSLMEVEERDFPRSFHFDVQDEWLVAGETYAIAFKPRDLPQMEGYQFTLDFDQEKVSLESIEYAIAKEENFGLNFEAEGAITTSWNRKTQEAINTENKEVMFSLILKAKQSIWLSELLGISSRYTIAEAYDQNDELLDIMINFEGDAAQTAPFRLYQNRPNPFYGKTTIGFDLPESTEATLTIYDLTGRMVKVIQNDFSAGYNEIEVAIEGLSSGLLYYTLETAEHAATRKMMHIEK
ncbi:MAG: hypothetical protein DHS20C17_34090 [Cyclobacteriaceae bacterium]|nr:MAG: hypothetical protein DHS20C17_34090 [Cyclobacteriaceae bacterium]